MSPSKKEELLTTLTPVTESLRAGLGDDLLAIVLFGSQARRTATSESDWDLLLIARDLPSRPLARHLRLKTLLPDAWRARVSLLAKTPQEFAARIPSLYLDIALDGIVLYDPQHYITPRLAWLRRQIQARGLKRRRIGRDLMWHPSSPTWTFGWEGFL
jgi:predicted nucleotidyltransferase